MSGAGYGANGAIVYKFGEISDVATAIGTYTGAMDGALNDLYSDFAKLFANDFQGSAGEACNEARTKWNEGATQIKTALNQVGLKLGAAADNMSATDKKIASTMNF